jgi:2-C-methyl-D-erythritol 4-phosphate cytidylyltransferase
MPSVWVIVVAAGSGSRFGRPKQYEELAGRPVLDWSLAAARATSAGPGDGVVVVVPPDRAGEPAPYADRVVAGGATRSGSVRAGLAEVPGDADIVVVHDGARPLAGADLFARVVEAVREGADAAVAAVGVTDTLRHRSGGQVDRDRLVAVQTPQAFRAAALRAAHAPEPEATDDASLVEATGGKVVIVEGSPANLKITRPIDLVIAEALLRSGEAP